MKKTENGYIIIDSLDEMDNMSAEEIDRVIIPDETQEEIEANQEQAKQRFFGI